MSKTETPERRRAERYPAQYKTDVVVLSGRRAGEEIEGEVIDVSHEGLGLVMQNGLSDGDQLGFVIFAEGYESLCVGHVVWKKTYENAVRYGLKISKWSYLDPALATRIRPPRYS
jgi:hypothetical protein